MALLVLAATFVVGTSFCHADYVSSIFMTPAPSWPAREFRGAWVATVSNIDWPTSSHSTPSAQQAELRALFDTLHKLNFNAVVFQVRTEGDAFYESKIDPWSRFLTGQQGREPSPKWDPLSTAIQEAHARGMELHAWFNPYRARSGSSSKTGLASNHIANQLPQYTYAYGNNLWVDPGAEDVKSRTYNTIMDVVNRYDIDGIHFDDYFYPYPISGEEFPDSHTYSAYKAAGGNLSRDAWRHHNVDWLVQSLSKTLKDVRPWVKFGISPFGIWMSGQPSGVVGLSSNTALFADSRKWLMEGWVDYLTPQIYWEISAAHQSFTALSDWWLNQNPKARHLYPGCATYKIVDSNWPITELQHQVEQTRSRRSRHDLGNIFFSAKYYRDNTHGIADLFKSTVYPSPALPPSMEWLHTNTFGPYVPEGVAVNSGTITWNATTSDGVRAHAVYRYDDSTKHWVLLHVLGPHTRSLTVEPGNYALTAVNRVGTESNAQTIIVTTPLVG